MMKKTERVEELRKVADYLDSIMDDLIYIRHRLEGELRCKVESNRVDTIIGKVYEVKWKLWDKSHKIS